MTSLPVDSNIDSRIREARQFWQQGQQAEQQGDWRRAYACYTSAHDLVIDCAALHEEAHQHLRRANLRLGQYGELFTDWALAMFAPLGVFNLVAWRARAAGGWFHAACKRG